MKKLFSFAICFLLIESVFAQKPDTGKYDSRLFHFGVEGGVSINNIIPANSPSISHSSLTGYGFGFTAEIPIEYNFSFITGISYSAEAYRAYSSFAGDFKNQSTYISIPILLNVKTAFKLNFFIGPDISYLTSGKNSYDGVYFGSLNDIAYTSNHLFIGGVIGLRFDITRYLNIHAKAAANFNKNTSDNTIIPEYRSESFQFGVGIKFN